MLFLSFNIYSWSISRLGVSYSIFLLKSSSCFLNLTYFIAGLTIIKETFWLVTKYFILYIVCLTFPFLSDLSLIYHATLQSLALRLLSGDNPSNPNSLDSLNIKLRQCVSRCQTFLIKAVGNTVVIATEKSATTKTTVYKQKVKRLTKVRHKSQLNIDESFQCIAIDNDGQNCLIVRAGRLQVPQIDSASVKQG